MNETELKISKSDVRHRIKSVRAEMDQRKMIYLMKYPDRYNENNFLNLIDLGSDVIALKYQLKERFVLSITCASGLIVEGIATDYQHLKRKAAKKLMDGFKLSLVDSNFALKSRSEINNIPLKFDPIVRLSLLKAKLKSLNILHV